MPAHRGPEQDRPELSPREVQGMVLPAHSLPTGDVAIKAEQYHSLCGSSGWMQRPTTTSVSGWASHGAFPTLHYLAEMPSHYF